MTWPRQIRDQDDAVSAGRERMDEIHVSFALLEELIGFQQGYLAKLLGPARVKRFSLQGFLEFCEGAALKVTIEPDLEAAQRMAARWEKRDEIRRRPGIIRRRYSPEVRSKIMSEIGRMGGSVPKRFRMTDKQRSRIAKRNIRKRWDKRKTNTSHSSASAAP